MKRISQFPMPRLLDRRASDIRGILVRKDNSLLSWNYTGDLMIWNKLGILTCVLEGHQSTVNGALIREQDGVILSWSDDGTLRLWSNVGIPIAVLEGHAQAVKRAIIRPDNTILSWSMDGTLRLWSFEGEAIAVLKRHHVAILNARLLPDGKIVSWARDRFLMLWNTDGQFLTEMRLEDDWVGDVAIHKDGTILAWSEACEGFGDLFSQVLSLWKCDGIHQIKLIGHKRAVLGGCFLRDGRMLSWSMDTTLRIWDASGIPLAVLAGHTDTICGALVRKDDTILSWGNDGTLRSWTDQGQPDIVFAGHHGKVIDVRILDDERILSWGADRTFRLWNADGTGQVIFKQQDMISGVLVIDDGSIISWGEELNIWLWKVRKKMSFPESPSHVTVRPDGCLVTWRSRSLFRILTNTGRPFLLTESGNAKRNHFEDINTDLSVLIFKGNQLYRGYAFSPKKSLAWIVGKKNAANNEKKLAHRSDPLQVSEKILEVFQKAESNKLADALYISLRSAWAVAVFELMASKLCISIKGIQITAPSFLDPISGFFPEMDLELFQISHFVDSTVVEGLYALNAQHLILFNCPQLVSVSGSNSAVKELQVISCPQFKSACIEGPTGKPDILPYISNICEMEEMPEVDTDEVIDKSVGIAPEPAFYPLPNFVIW